MDGPGGRGDDGAADDTRGDKEPGGDPEGRFMTLMEVLEIDLVMVRVKR